jgi:integrase
MAAAALIRFETPEAPGLVLVRRSADQAQAYVENSKAPNTRRGYNSDWRTFAAWCTSTGLDSLPARPETVALYIAALAEKHKPATIGRHLAAIASAHKAQGFNSPASMQNGAVSAVWHGIRRVHGTVQAQKEPILTPDLRAMVGTLPDRLLAKRDRALLVVGFAGAFRRSELVGLNREDIEFTADGLVATLRRSKTDQDGAGRKVGLPYGSNPDTCPVRSLRAWLDASGIEAGPVFRHVNRHGKMQPGRLSGTAVALVVKRHAGAAGLDPAKVAGHSLRAGLATSAAIAGASERSIMAQTGHRSANMVRRYIRDASLFRDNAAAVVGL